MGKFKTDFLVATPSVVSGAGRLFDWYGQFDQYNISPSGATADTTAMASDWGMVGDDIRSAISEYESSI